MPTSDAVKLLAQRKRNTEKMRVYRTRMIGDGRCPICGNTLYSKSLCKECLEKTNLRARTNNRRLREAALKAYGGVCACCGEGEARFLTIDHIHGGGHRHRMQVGKSGTGIHRWLKREGYPGGFQVLCWNCNAGKAYNGGVCPHKQRLIDDAED